MPGRRRDGPDGDCGIHDGDRGTDGRFGPGGWHGAARLAQEHRAQGRAVGCQPASGKSAPEPSTPLGQPVLERPSAPVQSPGGLRLGHTLQVTANDRETVLLGQPVDLLVQCWQQIVRGRWPVRRSCDSHLSHLPFEPAAPGRGDIGLIRDAMRDPVQPAPQGISSPDCAASLDQDQEGRLEGVLGVVRIA